MTHGGLEQLHYELAMSENTLRRLMDDPELLRTLGLSASGFAQLWRGLKQAQAETDYLRVVLRLANEPVR